MAMMKTQSGTSMMSVKSQKPVSSGTWNIGERQNELALTQNQNYPEFTHSLAEIANVGQVEANDLEDDHQNEGEEYQDDPYPVGGIGSGDLKIKQINK